MTFWFMNPGFKITIGGFSCRLVTLSYLSLSGTYPSLGLRAGRSNAIALWWTETNRLLSAGCYHALASVCHTLFQERLMATGKQTEPDSALQSNSRTQFCRSFWNFALVGSLPKLWSSQVARQICCYKKNRNWIWILLISLSRNRV